MRNRRSDGFRARLVLAAVLVVALAPIGADAGIAKRTAKFVPSGFAGTEIATMQPVTTPARPARVAYVPGTNGREAWAIGLSSALGKGWDFDNAGGQVLFMRYTPDTGWQIDGPPVDEKGVIVNPNLYALALAPNGEGWAVGAEGQIVHRAPGGKWVLQTERPSQEDLRSISLVGNGSSLTGYVVGDASRVAGSQSTTPTILKLTNGKWAPDPSASPTRVSGDLTAVSAYDGQNAWAVSGSAAKSVTIYRRTIDGWDRVPTGQAIFDGAPGHPVLDQENNLLVRQASGASVAAVRDGAWVGGVIYVTDPTRPFGDDSGRPFVIRLTNGAGGGAVSYCPPKHALSNGTEANEIQICDETFPTAPYDVTSIVPLSNGEVFAGGLGLFHFTRAGRWVREPNANGYLISLAFASATEGWVASTGRIYGAGGTAYSSQTTLGHWTTKPVIPRMARWPQPNAETLEGVAVAPDGSGEVLAAGTNGAFVHYSKARGSWEVMDRPDRRGSHAIAWPLKQLAFAVGDVGTIYRFNGTRWLSDPASQVLTTRPLFGVAFKGPNGFAVGADGTILRYAGGRWSVDAASGRVTNRHLYAIASTPTGFLAVGAGATIIEHVNGAWIRGGNVAARVTRPRFDTPAFNAIAVYPEGSVVIGGAQSALLRRPAGTTAWTNLPSTIEGTIVALAVTRQGLVASVSQADTKYAGSRLAAPATQLMVLDERGWHDVQLANYQTVSIESDPSMPADAIFGIVSDPAGGAGWAVGGTLQNTEDENGHAFSTPTSAIYRFDLAGDPSPPDDTWVPDLPEGKAFAYFGETQCKQGLCSVNAGSGTNADLIPALIQREVNLLSKMRNGPQFLLFGGSMRGRGIPEELAQFKSYLSGYEIPTYAALGRTDRFVDSTTDVTEAGSQVTSGGATEVLPSNKWWRQTFADMPRPWGTGAKPSWIVPVEYTATGPTVEGARTHYAFDVKDDAGKTVFRVVVLDTSLGAINDSNTTTSQNPQEDQLAEFIPRVMPPCATGCVPTVVAYNQPTLNPYFLGSEATACNWCPPSGKGSLDQVVSFHAAVAQRGGIAALQAGFPFNGRYVPLGTLPRGVAFYYAGGGGRAFDYTHHVLDGFFNAWLLVTVEGDGTLAGTKTTVKTMPVLDSVAMHAVDGAFAPAGDVLRFEGLARFPMGGAQDLQSAKATYVKLPLKGRCGGPGLLNGRCSARDSHQPEYEFATTDPKKAMFVRWDFGNDRPARDRNGALIPSTTSGYLCTLEPGDTTVLLRMGLKQARYPISIGSGFGKCVDEPKIKPPPPPPPPPPPLPEPEPKPFYYFGGDTTNAGAALFPPIPAPVVAPAPPGAPGVGRKEEHEVQTETEGHGDTSMGFSALERPARDPYLSSTLTALRARREDPAAQAWPLMSGVIALAFMSAVFAASRRERRPAWQRDPGSR